MARIEYNVCDCCGRRINTPYMITIKVVDTLWELCGKCEDALAKYLRSKAKEQAKASDA